VLAITGSGFDADDIDNNRVWVGGKECYVRSVTATEIVCRSRGGGTWGELPVVVMVGDEYAESGVSILGRVFALILPFTQRNL
jgi:hypothetical protein